MALFTRALFMPVAVLVFSLERFAWRDSLDRSAWREPGEIAWRNLPGETAWRDSLEGFAWRFAKRNPFSGNNTMFPNYPGTCILTSKGMMQEEPELTRLEACELASLFSSAPCPTVGSIVCITVTRPPVDDCTHMHLPLTTSLTKASMIKSFLHLHSCDTNKPEQNEMIRHHTLIALTSCFLINKMIHTCMQTWEPDKALLLRKLFVV